MVHARATEISPASSRPLRRKAASASETVGLDTSSSGASSPQPAREVLEQLLIAPDWGEAFTALNLAVNPALDSFFKQSLAEAAQAHGDSLTAQLLRESGVDSARSNAWTSALATHAVAQRAENLPVLDKWIEKWRPAAKRATGPLSEILP